MKLKDLLKETKTGEIQIPDGNPSTTCQYLDSVGVKYKKIRKPDGSGATFEISSRYTPTQVKNLVDDILSVPEIMSTFNVGYAGGNTIVVEMLY